MIDIIIPLENEHQDCERCIAHIEAQVNPPPYQIHVIPFVDDKLNLGSKLNVILGECNFPIFTIINPDDFYILDALSSIMRFIKNKSFGLVNAGAMNQINNREIIVSRLPHSIDNIYSVNPIRPPVFYNRKLVDYLLLFDFNTSFPEYDMILKIWERFPVFSLDAPLLYTKLRVPPPNTDLDTVIYNSRVRGRKMFFTAGVNLYPAGLLDPIVI